MREGGNYMQLVSRWTYGRQIYWGVTIFLIFLGTTFFIYDESLTFKITLTFILSILSLVITLIALGSFKILSQKPVQNRNLLYWEIVLFIFFIILLIDNHTVHNIINVFSQHRYFFLSTLSAAGSSILEETICRGLFLTGFLGLAVYEGFKRKLFFSAIMSAALFSIFHLMNLIGGNFDFVLKQLFYTFAVGIFFSLLRFSTNSLFLPILVHFILDFVPINSSISVNTSWVATLIIFLPILFISSVILLKLDNLNNEIYLPE